MDQKIVPWHFHHVSFREISRHGRVLATDVQFIDGDKQKPNVKKVDKHLIRGVRLQMMIVADTQPTTSISSQGSNLMFI